MTTALRSYCVQSETVGFSPSRLWFKGWFFSVEYNANISLFFGRLGGVLSHLKKAYSGECGIAQSECSPKRKKNLLLLVVLDFFMVSKVMLSLFN